MVENARRRCLKGEKRVLVSVMAQQPESTHKNDDAETTSRQEQVDPGLNLVCLDVIARRDDAGLI